MTSPTHACTGQSTASVLAIGFGSATAMWTAGYLTHMPALPAPIGVTFALLVLALVAGGWLLARFADSRWSHAALAALLTATINLLVLGSLLRDDAAAMPAPWIWLPGFFAASVALVLIGWSLGRRPSNRSDRHVNWSFVFALVTVAATGLLVIAGGLVTGYDAGLAVPDWPDSFHANMFLYPLSRMTGGIYYEHTHRLLGSLVGLTTIVLTIHLWRTDRRRSLRLLLLVAVAAVILQGFMGGHRVTMAAVPAGGVDVSTPEHETTASIALRLAHGAFGQIFLALVVAAAAMTSTTWRQASPAAPPRKLRTDQTLGLLLLAAILTQLVLGAALRQLQVLLLWHIALATVVTLLAMIAGLRAWGLYPDSPVLPRLGLWLIFATLAQLALGTVALLARKYQGNLLPVNALITTTHQAVGALLLALAVTQTLWSGRLARPQ